MAAERVWLVRAVVDVPVQARSDADAEDAVRNGLYEQFPDGIVHKLTTVAHAEPSAEGYVIAKQDPLWPGGAPVASEHGPGR